MAAASVSSALAAIQLPDSDGVAWRLGTFWDATPAVLVFLRHYG